MPKLLQIDSCLGVGSTGRITEGIGNMARRLGWESYVAHGSRYVGETKQISYKILSKYEEYYHICMSILTGKHGLYSSRATRRLISFIEKLNPDIIHLHCIHGYYLNYEILFDYLNSKHIPIVWTFHDCWAFTGHCAHFITKRCYKWTELCGECPLLKTYPISIFDSSRNNYKLKRRLFSSSNNMHIVSVSYWINAFLSKSYLKNVSSSVIHNGVDTNVFKPRERRRESKNVILGVSGVWNESKGLYDFYRLREMLAMDTYDIILVGLSSKQLKNLPKGIIGYSKTNSVDELVQLYSNADVFVNPTYADTFPTVNIEALSCGTPVVTYNTGGSVEAVDSFTGRVVEQGNLQELAKNIDELCNLADNEKEIIRNKCRERVLSNFDMLHRYSSYIDLYKKLIRNK